VPAPRYLALALAALLLVAYAPVGSGESPGGPEVPGVVFVRHGAKLSAEPEYPRLYVPVEGLDSIVLVSENLDTGGFLVRVLKATPDGLKVLGPVEAPGAPALTVVDYDAAGVPVLVLVAEEKLSLAKAHYTLLVVSLEAGEALLSVNLTQLLGLEHNELLSLAYCEGLDTLAVVSDWENTVYAVNVLQGEAVWATSLDPPIRVAGEYPLVKGDTLYLYYNNGSAYLYATIDCAAGQVLGVEALPVDGLVYEALAAGDYMIFNLDNSRVVAHNPETGELVEVATVDQVTIAGASPSGRYVAVKALWSAPNTPIGYTLTVYDLAQRRTAATLEFPNATLEDVAWSPGGDYLVYELSPLAAQPGAPMTAVGVVHLATGEVIGEIASKSTIALAWHGDTLYAALGSARSYVNLTAYNVSPAGLTPVHAQPVPHRGNVDYLAAFDGPRLVLAAFDVTDENLEYVYRIHAYQLDPASPEIAYQSQDLVVAVADPASPGPYNVSKRASFTLAQGPQLTLTINMRAWKGHIIIYKNAGGEWYERHDYGLLLELTGGALQVSAPITAEARVAINTIIPSTPTMIAHGEPSDFGVYPAKGKLELYTSFKANGPTTKKLPAGLLAIFPAPYQWNASNALASPQLPPDAVTVEVVVTGEDEAPATQTTEPPTTTTGAAAGTETGGEEETPTATSEAPVAIDEAGGGVPAAALAGALIALIAAALLLLKRR